MESKQVIILTGDIQSGKTTSLLKWIDKRTDVAGVLTPIMEGSRKFYTISHGVFYNMEAENGELETQDIGRYKFSSTQFQRVNFILNKQLSEDKWNYIVIDEIGPLELAQQKGLWPALELIFKAQFTGTCILVVRKRLSDLMKVMVEKNGLAATVITTSQLDFI